MSLTIFLDLAFGIRVCLGLGVGVGKSLDVGETLLEETSVIRKIRTHESQCWTDRRPTSFSANYYFVDRSWNWGWQYCMSSPWLGIGGWCNSLSSGGWSLNYWRNI